MSFKFAIMGDTRSDGDDNGVNIAMVEEICDDIGANSELAFVLGVGDYWNSTTHNAIVEFRTAASGIDTKDKYFIRGNHEHLGDNSGDEWSTAGPTGMVDWLSNPTNGPTEMTNAEHMTFHFDYGNATFIGLDEYIERQTDGTIDQTWLDAVFAAGVQEHVFVFAHEPLFGVLHTDCMDDNAAARDLFVQSAAAQGSKVYFCGHDHLFNVHKLNKTDGTVVDFYNYIIGTGGAPLREDTGAMTNQTGWETPELIKHLDLSDDAYGYAICEVYGDTATVQFMRRTAANTFEVQEDATISYTLPESAKHYSMGGKIITINGKIVIGD